jgi:hypothetical protein
MRLGLAIYKWIIFEFMFFMPDVYEEGDFTYLSIGLFVFHFCIEKYYGRISLIFQIINPSSGEAIFDWEKVIKEGVD